MKIGIVSLYGWLRLWDNYGTLLQNYALQSYLRKHGHETFLIRTKPTTTPETPADYSVEDILRSPRRLAEWLVWQLHGKPKRSKMATFNRKHPRAFAAFLKKRVPHTRKELTLETLIEAPPPADAYIVGSDQVWRDVTPLNFLAFGPSNVPRIAYAVSAPWPALSEDWYGQAAVEVERFQAVSVREVDGLGVCAEIGRSDAAYVVDPTLLLTREDYRRLVRAEGRDKSFPGSVVLGYFVNVRKLSQIPWKGIRGLAKTKGADLRVVPLQGSELIIPQRYVFTPSPAGWINAFDKAECVVTNSFHGSLFAVLMHKPFLVFLQAGATAAENCRFVSALGTLGLESRILAVETWERASSEDLKRGMDVEINWEDVDSRLQEFRRASEAFLLDALDTPVPRER